MDNGACSYRRFLEGDEKAFDEIMEAYFYKLIFFIERYTKDFHAAEDIAMDVFSDLIVHRFRYNFKVSLKTYLFMLGRSRAIDWLRRRKVINFVQLTEASYVCESEDLENLVLKDQQKRILNNALSKLPDDMHTAIYLVYFEEMSYDECAKVMKKTNKQIDNLLYRAKKQLRVILGEDGDCLL